MLSLPSADEIRADLAATSLREFITQAWPIVEPGTRFVPNWHIDAICEHLEAQTRGELPKLIVNVPPRHMKSLTATVFWPCWEWLTRPDTRWLFASYASVLSTRDSIKCRDIIQWPGLDTSTEDRTLLERVGYRRLLHLLGRDWSLADDQNLKTRFKNTAGGYRIATSVGGSATGEGGDRLVLDDPHKADEVTSDVIRTSDLDWNDQTWTTRRNDPKASTQTLIMQRLHERDLTGHLLEKGGWEHLCLPAEYEPSHPFIWPQDPRTEPGELLWPQRMGEPEVAEMRRELGGYGFAGQFQQLPAPAEGGIFKTAWWRYYDRALLDFDPGDTEWQGPRFDRLWASWDTALKEKTSNDYSVGQLWAAFGPDRYLLRQLRGRWALPELITQALDLHAWAAARWPGHAGHSVFVENTANGPELIAALRRRVQGVRPVTADRDKVSRAHAVTPQIEAGNVLLPGDRQMTSNGWAPDPHACPPWVLELTAECASFPNAAHDDQVDALTQALDPRRLRSDTGRRHHARGGTVTGAWNTRDV